MVILVIAACAVLLGVMMTIKSSRKTKDNFNMFQILTMLSIALILSLTGCVWAGGDLTSQKPIDVVVDLGTEQGDYAMFCSKGCKDPKVTRFETGKLYRLILLNKSKQKHYFTSYSLARKVFTRKVLVMKGLDKMEGWSAEVKGGISEVEVAPMTRTDWYFVPVKTGKADDVHCNIKVDDGKDKGKTHSDLGVRMSYEIY